jgi:hypothetical protein
LEQFVPFVPYVEQFLVQQTSSREEPLDDTTTTDIGTTTGTAVGTGRILLSYPQRVSMDETTL